MTASYPLFSSELQAPNSISSSTFSGWLINQKRNSQAPFFCKHHVFHLLQQNCLCYEWGQLSLPFVLNSLILCSLRTLFPPVLCFCTWIASCFLLHFLHACFKCCYFFFHFEKPPLTQLPSSDSSLFLFFRNSLGVSKQLSAQGFLGISSQQSCLWLFEFICWQALNGQSQFLSMRPTGKVDKVDLSAVWPATTRHPEHLMVLFLSF